MAIVVTGPNNYVGIKANKIHPRRGESPGWRERSGGKATTDVGERGRERTGAGGG